MGPFINRPLAATSSCDLLFIRLWAATLRMPEMEKNHFENLRPLALKNEFFLGFQFLKN